MVSFHPTARKLHNGAFVPMVIVRNPKGQCVGSRVSIGREFTDKDAAKNFARNAAHKVAERLTFTRVA